MSEKKWLIGSGHFTIPSNTLRFAESLEKDVARIKQRTAPIGSEIEGLSVKHLSGIQPETTHSTANGDDRKFDAMLEEIRQKAIARDAALERIAAALPSEGAPEPKAERLPASPKKRGGSLDGRTPEERDAAVADFLRKHGKRNRKVTAEEAAAGIGASKAAVARTSSMKRYNGEWKERYGNCRTRDGKGRRPAVIQGGRELDKLVAEQTRDDAETRVTSYG